MITIERKYSPAPNSPLASTRKHNTPTLTMTATAALLAFTLTAAILTITPGIDTALVLRTAAVEGTRRALMAGLGICAGCLIWGALAAFGLGSLLAVSTLAYDTLRICAAAYLFYLGAKLLWRTLPRRARAVQGEAGDNAGARANAHAEDSANMYAHADIRTSASADAKTNASTSTHATASANANPPASTTATGWFLRGCLTNALNPKVGIFYITFLPQFIPAGSNVLTFSLLLAAIHALLGVLWFGILVAATRPLSKWLSRPSVTRGLDRMTGAVFIAFGLKLALEKR